MRIIYRYLQDPPGTNDLYNHGYRFIATIKKWGFRTPKLGQTLKFFFDDKNPSLARTEPFVVERISIDEKKNRTITVFLRNDTEGVMHKSAYVENGWKIVEEWRGRNPSNPA